MGEISLEDARRFLSEDEYERFVAAKEILRRGTDSPSARKDYEYLCRKVLKEKENLAQARLLEGKYKKELKKDESRLRRWFDERKVKRREDALAYFLELKEEFRPLFQMCDPTDWYLGSLQEIGEIADERIAEMCHQFLANLWYPEAFECSISSMWFILIPKARFVKAGVDALKIAFHPYVVAGIEAYRKEHSREFSGWVFTFQSKKHFSGAKLLSSADLNLVLSSLIIPLSLVRGLMGGELQPAGCEITSGDERHLIYKVDGFEQEVTLTRQFVEFMLDLRGEADALRKIVELGLLDEMGARIIKAKEGKMLPEVQVVLRGRDREHLKRIYPIRRPRTYSQWGEILGLGRSGAYRTLHRLVKEGLVALEKVEDVGIRTTLTEKGVRAIS